MTRLDIRAAAAVGTLLASPAWTQENLTALTSNPGHPVHLTVTHLAEVAADEGIANIQVSAGQTGTNAVLAVAEGTVDIGICPFILPFLMQRGAGPYSNLGAEKGAELAANISLLYPYSFGAYILYGYDSAGVRGWDDLEGRRILNGPPRGAATNTARAMLKVVAGLDEGEGPQTYKGIHIDWGQMTTTITEGGADVALLPEVVPSDRPIQALSAGKMTFWSVPKAVYESEGMQNMLHAPGSVPFTLPVTDLQALGANATIASEDDTFRTLGASGGNCVGIGMEEQMAYELTRAHIATLDALEAKAPYAKYINLRALDPEISGVCGPIPVRYHPGAVRAWEEAGYPVPDCAKP